MNFSLTSTIIEFQPITNDRPHKCGYCKSNSSLSNGMWAHRMSVGTYQALIDRGWRRSGRYCYKPVMDVICCPQYTIKCDVTDFKMSKSQKKVLKRMHKYLSFGKSKNDEHGSSNAVSCCEMNVDETLESTDFIQPQFVAKDLPNLEASISLSDNRTSTSLASKSKTSSCKTNPSPSTFLESAKKTPKPGIGANLSKGICKKAKDLRRERKAAKLAHNKTSDINSSHQNKSKNTEKTLEDFLNAPFPENPAHKLELRLVHSSVSDIEFFETFSSSAEVFKQYQMMVHKSPTDECDKTSFREFLCDSPLSACKSSNSPPLGYGSFHHQYWLDDELIAVGVLDVLPNCISSVYLFYNPEYSFLSLGTYTSLREIALTRELQKYNEDLMWYYMGFYIHSCPKMRYKGQYCPSYLLCPETYTWVDIDQCIPKIEAFKYSRLNPLQISQSSIDINKIICLYDKTIIPFEKLREMGDFTKESEVLEGFVQLVGESAYTLVYVL